MIKLLKNLILRAEQTRSIIVILLTLISDNCS